MISFRAEGCLCFTEIRKIAWQPKCRYFPWVSTCKGLPNNAVRDMFVVQMTQSNSQREHGPDIELMNVNLN
jgi:hypothetical protein